MLLLALVVLAAACAFAAAVLSWTALRRADRPADTPRDLADKLLLIESAVQGQPAHFRDELRSLRETADTRGASLREEVKSTILAIGAEQRAAFEAFRAELGQSHQASTTAFKQSSDDLKTSQGDRLTDLSRRLTDLSDRMEQKEKEAREAQRTELEKVTGKIGDLTKANDERQEKLREALNENMATLRRENEAKLEQMRVTVDEKLQGTLDQRLGESFKLVGDRLESVQKGLGEMQQLAAGVGDLKRVLTNVKSRGTWGEVQLGALLEDMLTPDQYAAQVRVQPDRGEVVDYVVHLPGASEAGRVLLPIDCKFPHEDYDRLLAAQEAGDPVAVEIAGKALERAVRTQAKSINEKYVHPPASTNFAIMYLPTEGLFAEVVRRPGLVADLQQTCRVTVTGPTTLSAVLNSLRMGFTTLAIQKRSSEVWTVLGEAKKAFLDYGAAFDAVDKKLDEAKKKVAEVGVKHRAVSRKLRGVESLEAIPEPLEVGPKLLALAGLAEEEDEAA